MKKLFRLFTVTFFIIVASPLFAHNDNDEAKRLFESGDILALEVILKKAREIQEGKVLEVELEKKMNIIIYEIELLASDGTVYELKFNAKSGEHLSTEKEN